MSMAQPGEGVATSTRILLLIEDNPGDAELVRDLLEEAGGDGYQLIHTENMASAIDILQQRAVDVVLLDLRLPDAVGAESVRQVRSEAGDTPIVVLTGTDDEELAMSCLHAGADDFLRKGEIHPIPLRRSIGYAITRRREAQIRELEATIERYRGLAQANTSVTAVLVGSGVVRERYPEDFHAMTVEYAKVLGEYLDQLILKRPKPRAVMERLITHLGDRGGGPRDLVELHLAALDHAADGRPPERSRALTLEGRLAALEMMGLLVDYYRVGHRRLFPEETGE